MTAAAAILFTSLAATPPWGTFQSDLAVHLLILERFLGGDQVLPHPGFHLLVAGVDLLTPLPLAVAAVVVLTGSTLAAIILVRTQVASATARTGLVAALTVGLSTASALIVPWFNDYWYLGQGTPNIWHSPTWIVMQPLALGAFFASVASLGFLDDDRRRRRALAGAALLAASVLVKPNFAAAFIPALGVVAVTSATRARSLRRIVEVAVLAAPAVVVLGIQFLVQYGSGESGGLVLAPLEVWRLYSPNVLVSLLLAAAFPLAALVVRPRALQDVADVRAAWATFVVALLQWALLAESGERFQAANWSWGYYMALKLLFVVSAVDLLRSGVHLGPGRRRAVWAVFGLHVAFGLLYLARFVSGGGYR